MLESAVQDTRDSVRQTSGFSAAVIICTRDRPESLRRTLDSFAAADRNGLALRIVVVNNSPSGEADDVVRGFGDRLPIVLAHEGRPGKGNALNRGLSECGGVDVIAVVDDDITVEPEWLQGVRRITQRWPDKGFFAGSLFVAWPRDDLPSWTRDPVLAPWAYSVMATRRDRVFQSGQWADGGCFWLRAELLPPGYTFPDTWLTEAPFMLDLVERGFCGVIAPDARAWHHIGTELLDVTVLQRRAVMAGKAIAVARLLPYRRTVRQAALFHQHPLLTRVACALSVVRWIAAGRLARFSRSAERRIVRSIEAAERAACFRQYLSSCRGVSEYRIRVPFSRKPAPGNSADGRASR